MFGLYCGVTERMVKSTHSLETLWVRPALVALEALGSLRDRGPPFCPLVLACLEDPDMIYNGELENNGKDEQFYSTGNDGMMHHCNDAITKNNFILLDIINQSSYLSLSVVIYFF